MMQTRAWGGAHVRDGKEAGMMERARASLGGENMQSEGSDTPREGERQRMQPRGYGKK